MYLIWWKNFMRWIFRMIVIVIYLIWYETQTSYTPRRSNTMAEVINPDVQGTPNFCQQFLPCSLLTYAGGVDELFTINLESKKPWGMPKPSVIHSLEHLFYLLLFWNEKFFLKGRVEAAAVQWWKPGIYWYVVYY